jgi:hypothetical protein
MRLEQAADVNKIIMLEKIFPTWFETHLEKYCLDLEWSYSEVDSFHKEGKEQFFTVMAHEFNSGAMPQHKKIVDTINDALTIDVIPLAVPSAEIQGLARLRFNGTMRGVTLYPHIDFRDSSAWVLVYYVNDSDGDTVFYANDHKTEIARSTFKKGNAVLFPANIFHKADSPTKNPFRISIGAHYLMRVPR